jgi:hypothetical protein
MFNERPPQRPNTDHKITTSDDRPMRRSDTDHAAQMGALDKPEHVSHMLQDQAKKLKDRLWSLSLGLKYNTELSRIEKNAILEEMLKIETQLGVKDDKIVAL